MADLFLYPVAKVRSVYSADSSVYRTWTNVDSRERFYEFFKATHFFAALVFVIFFFLHCDHILTSWDYFIAAAVLYALPWLYSQCRTYFEHGLRHRASLTMETSSMLKITVATAAGWRPGQHVYLRFLTQGVHALTAHPFTICSLQEGPLREDGRSEMVFYVRVRGGLTKRLGRLAEKTPGVSVPVLLDGPYGGVQGRWFGGFDHHVVIGGGAGAGFALALAQDFISQSQLAPKRNTKMTLVVSSRDLGLKQWFLDALSKVALEGEKDADAGLGEYGLSVRIHETGDSEPSTEYSEDHHAASTAATDKETAGPQKTSVTHLGNLKGISVSIAHGRADLFALGREVVTAEGTSVGIAVCGPASMVHDAGRVAASAQGNIVKGGPGPSEVWFHKESFS